MTKNTRLNAISDIKPVNETGVVELELASVVRLRTAIKTQKDKKHAVELEKWLNNDFNFKAELISAGAKLSEVEPRIEVQPQNPQEIDFDKILGEINRASLYIHPKEYAVQEPVRREAVKEVSLRERRTLSKKLLLIPVILAIGFFAWRYGLSVRDDIVQSGNSAVANLEQAKINLEHLNLKEALVNFSAAHEEFVGAGNSLNLMGNFMGSLLGQVPGNSQYNSVRKLVEAGKLFSQSGE